MKTSKLIALFFSCLTGILPIAAVAGPFTVSAAGDEVTDQKTGLTWRRCSEGMNWNGSSCAGTAGTFTHEAALQHAAAQAASTGVAWRLPNVKELSSIADRSRSNPAIDPTAFPATPSIRFWSSSPYWDGSLGAWYVNFNDGYVDEGNRANSGHSLPVRLVRFGQ